MNWSSTDNSSVTHQSLSLQFPEGGVFVATSKAAAVVYTFLASTEVLLYSAECFFHLCTSVSLVTKKMFTV